MVLEVTGRRNPCKQLDELMHGLMPAALDRDVAPIRKAGIIKIVRTIGGTRLGDTIHTQLPPEPHEKLDRV